MKTFKLIGASAAAALFLLTSCLGEGGNTTSGSSFAVGATTDKTFKTILNTVAGPIYSPILETKVTEGACYSVSFEVDLDTPENANVATNGYYTASINNILEVTKGQAVFYNVPDTAKLLVGEIPLTNAGVDTRLGYYIDNYLFFGGNYNGLKDQKNTWALYWDRSKEPETINNVITYSLFLRAVKVSDGTGTSVTSFGDMRAYNIGSEVKRVSSSMGSDAQIFNIKVNYLSNINEKDSTDLSWKSVTLQMPVIKNK